MKLSRCHLVCILLLSHAFGEGVPSENVNAERITSPPCNVVSQQALRVFPRVASGCDVRVSYLGNYAADGKYRALSIFSRRNTPADANLQSNLRPVEVPKSIDLHARERVVENFLPAMHPARPPKYKSNLAALRDDLVTFVYGRERLLTAPEQLTTDSKGRLIVSDPVISAVHVLDREKSFRIAGGRESRMQSVGAVAVDAEDNIYVADPEAGLVVVFDSDGHFLRWIGKIDNEGIFHTPAGIAIDRERGHLYVADSSHNMVFLLDLQGHTLLKIGGNRDTVTPGSFDHPSAIAVKHSQVFLLDAEGTRVRIFDLQLRLVREFITGLRNLPGLKRELGLDVDSEGDIYLTNIDGFRVRIYDPSGHLKTSIGSMGTRDGEFQSPAALWIDPEDRLFISDRENRRVQVFQIESNLPTE